MAKERTAIDNPFAIDCSSIAVPPFKFVLQTSYEPIGIIEQLSEGITRRHTPWFTEVVFDLVGVDAVAVIYQIPKDEDTGLLLACLDETVQPFFELMTGADFGDELTKLVALNWPEQYGMLLRSQSNTPTGRILCPVWTAQKMQWAVADVLPGHRRESVSADHLIDLIRDAVETFLRVTRPSSELPGIVDVLGGPDQMSRRLTAASKLLSGAAGLGGLLQGGVNIGNAYELAKGAKSLFDQFRALRD